MNDGGAMMELAMLLFFALCIVGGIVILYGLGAFMSSRKQDEKDEKLTEEEDDKLIP
jgi:ABC-type cobalt transport system substrate-binding protein